jgi:hypothetical protein
MAIHQTLVGLESNFANRASILSRVISRDDRIVDNESSWLLLRAAFPMSSVRIYNRASDEIRVPTDTIDDIISNSITAELDGTTDLSRNVSIGAMYRDDLPISGVEYSNIFIVVSFDLVVDIPLPRDAHVAVEVYIGWRKIGRNMRIADNFNLDVSVSNVGYVRRNRVRSKVISILTNTETGASPLDQIRDGLRPFFEFDNIRNWYVIPGDGNRTGQDSNILVRQEASFFVVR